MKKTVGIGVLLLGSRLVAQVVRRKEGEGYLEKDLRNSKVKFKKIVI